MDKMSSKYDTVTLIELVESRPRLWGKTSEEFKGPGAEKQALACILLLLGAKILTIGQKGANESRYVLQINIYV